MRRRPASWFWPWRFETKGKEPRREAGSFCAQPEVSGTDLDAFGVGLAEAIHERLGEPVEFDHTKAAIRIGAGDVRAEIALETFYGMHEGGEALGRIADRIASLWTETKNPPPLAWEEVKDRVVAHVVRHPPAVPQVVVAQLSPLLGVAAAVDSPDYLRILLPRDLEAMAVSQDVVREVARLNMERALAGAPGKEETSPFGHRVVVFEGDLAADRAYALSASLPTAAAAFLAPEFAIVSRDTEQSVLGGLGVMATVGAKSLHLTHRFPPAVHIFQDGRVAALLLTADGV